MNTGFRETLQDRLLGVTAHISLTRPGSGGIHDYEALAAKLSKIPGVRSVTPAVYQTVLMTFGGESRGVVAKGIDPVREEAADEALRKLSAGKLDFQPDADGIDALLVGKQLADEWKLAPGDYVTLTSPQGRLTPFGLLPRTRRFRVAGVFDSGFYDYDANWCFLKMDAAQSLAGASDVVNVLEFRLQNPEAAPVSCAANIEQRAGTGFAATTWMEQQRALFRALRLEKLVTAIFIGLITLGRRLEHSGGAFDDGDRPRERHRRSASRWVRCREQLRNIFLWQGFAIGATGTVAGIGAGVFVRLGCRTHTT